MVAIDQPTDGRLGDAKLFSEGRLGKSGFLQIPLKWCHRFSHMTECIGIGYTFAIGASKFRGFYHLPMRTPKRSFLDRALEALQERYPRDRPTQVRLAALAGVKQPSVVDWRKGVPAMDTGIRLAQALGVCVEWLYTERGPKRPNEPQAGSISSIWPELADDQREQLQQFADFIKARKS